MLLKRLFKGKSIKGVRVLHSGPTQKFTPRFLAKGQREGWLEFKDGLITLFGVPDNVVYKVVRTPGYYCCYSGIPLEDGQTARAHVIANYPNTPSPDPENPSGYRRDLFYLGVRVTPTESRPDWLSKIKNFMGG